MESATSLSRQIQLRLLVAAGDATTVPTTLVYSPADPYAVRAVMHTTDGPIEWIFSRDLLHEGLQRPSGVGDLHVAPGTDERGRTFLSLELSTPDGNAVLHADIAAMSTFLADTFRAVPLGEESAHLDIDAALALLVAGN
jgi:hypothetical protein